VPYICDHCARRYDWQLKVRENWHTTINETQGVFANSPDSPWNVTLSDPVVVNITVGEIGEPPMHSIPLPPSLYVLTACNAQTAYSWTAPGVEWIFSVAPHSGWAQRDGSFTIQVSTRRYPICVWDSTLRDPGHTRPDPTLP
jgi:hypothetical protein